MIKKKENTPIREKFEVSISKEELNQLPTEKYSGDIIVVDDDAGVEEAVRQLREAPIIGFDTETKPSFQKGQINHVALLQLAIRSKTFLVRLSKIGMPEQIKEILEDEKICKVGLSIKDDFHSINKMVKIEPKGFVDLQEYVKKFKISDCSLTKIHSIVFGKRISKSQQLTNWEASTLTPKQQEYAALDALACINIYQHLKSGAFIPEKSQFYKEITVLSADESKNA